MGHSQWLLTQHLLKRKEQPTGHQDQHHGEVEHAGLLCHHDPPIAVELVPAWEDLPLSLHSPLLGVSRFHGRGVMMGADLIVLTFPALIQSKMHVAGLVVYSSADAWLKTVESQNVCTQRRRVEKHCSWWTDGENVCVLSEPKRWPECCPSLHITFRVRNGFNELMASIDSSLIH